MDVWRKPRAGRDQRLETANGGRIGVERTGPAGTTFLIELPGVGPA